MPTEHGRGRYLMAALLLALEAPVLSVIALGAALSGALLAVQRAALAGARSARAVVAKLRSPRQRRRERARGLAPEDHRG